ncbi:MAG: shikimate dehydrogenase [Magnetococcales bacterium]|nr:shikimate dehydrogenase [Magnetococcales bacterium]
MNDIDPNLFSCFAIDGHTRLLGVIGHPVAHSLSPAMHNLALDALKLNYRYLPFPVAPEHLHELVVGLKAVGCAGFNITIPHKETIIRCIGGVGAEARWIGAVNTVTLGQDGRFWGYNTDAAGFMAALDEVYQPTKARPNVILMGAGGAAKAVVAGLLLAGEWGRITVVNRTAERAHRLLDDLMRPELLDEVGFYKNDVQLPEVEAISLKEAADLPLERCDLLVNTTSVGLNGEGSLGIDLDRLPEEAFIYDIVYSPLETPLLKEARIRGLAGANGLGMLIHQGALAFRIWTGEEMPVDMVRNHLRRLVGGI